MSSSACPELVSPFWPAVDYTEPPLQQREQACKIMCDRRFAIVASHMPDSEVDVLIATEEISRKIEATKRHKTEQTLDIRIQMRQALTYNRLANRICNLCCDKSDTKRLKVCSACHMTFYCSTECQAADWNGDFASSSTTKNAAFAGPARLAHSKWCCKKDAPPDTGPMRTAIVQLDSKKEQTSNGSK